MHSAPKIKQFLPIFLLKLVHDPIDHMTDLQKKYGDIFYKHFLGYDQYFICHPAFAEHILSSNQTNYRKHPTLAQNFQYILGENNLLATNNLTSWQRDRTLAQKVFEPDVFFEQYTQIVNNKCDQMFNQWQTQYQKNPVPITHELSHLVLSIINDTIFQHLNLDIELMAQHIPEIFSLLRDRSLSLTNLLWLLPTPKRFRLQREIKFIQDAAKKALLSRFNECRDYDDLLGELLHDYQIKDDTHTHFTTVGYQTMTFNIVGFSSTLAALLWVFTHLALYPDITDQMSEEITTICENQQPTLAHVNQLTYTKAVISEILRLYPPLAFYLRQAITNDQLGSYTLPANACVTVSPFHIHRHPDFWESPMTLNPERFLSKPWGQDYQFAYIPFGAGQRSCIAKNFAMLEICLIVTMALQRFKFSLPKDFELKKTYIASVFLRPNLDIIFLRDRA
mgnify:CR=1 FL=1